MYAFDMLQVRLSVEHLRAATAGASHELTLDLLRTARVFRCLWEVLVAHGGEDAAMPVMVFPFLAGAEKAGDDEEWDKVAAAFGLLGRGNGSTCSLVCYSHSLSLSRTHKDTHHTHRLAVLIMRRTMCSLLPFSLFMRANMTNSAAD